MPYKRPQIVRVLESLVEHEKIREVNATTKRLVQRCLGGDWCVQFRKVGSGSDKSDEKRVDSPGFDALSVTSAPQASNSRHEPSEDKPSKTLKSSRSAENLKSKHHRGRSGHLRETLHHHSNASSTSLPRVVASAVPPNLAAPRARRDRAESVNDVANASTQERKTSLLDETKAFTAEPEEGPGGFSAPAIRISSASTGSLDLSESPRSSTPTRPHPHSVPHSPVPRRSAPPPPPPKRRKPPAIPERARAGTSITGLTGSASQPVLSPLGSEARKASPP